MARTRLRTSESPAGLPQMVAGGLVLLLLAYALMTSFYTVSAESQAVVLRFGKVIKTDGPRTPLEAAVGNRPALSGAGPAAAQAGVRLRHPRSDEPVAGDRARRAGSGAEHRDGRFECRVGRVGGAVPDR